MNIKQAKEICEKGIPSPKSSPILDVRADAYMLYQRYATKHFPEALRIIEAQHKMLKKLEFIKRSSEPYIWRKWCPVCEKSIEQVHKPDCALAKILREVEL